jgi:RND family efflux transporter MFP subunit
MNAVRIILLVLIAGALAGGVGFWLGRHAIEPKQGDAGERTTNSDSDEQSSEEVVAHVEVVPLTPASISQTVTAFGTIVAEPSSLRIQSVPFESRIKHIDVTAGQEVSPQGKTVQLEASADALLALQEAKAALDAAMRDLTQTKQRLKDHLATNQELSQAQQALDAAKLRHQSLIDRGVGQSHQLSADVAGIVSKVNVQEGQIVPAGGALVEIAVGNRIEARLGVNEETVARLKVDQAVRLRRVDESPDSAIEGKVRLIGRRVDPATRLVEIRVTLPPSAKLLLDSAIVGEITLASEAGFVVPRNAALPGEAGEFVLFTIHHDHARKHAVRLGLQQAGRVQVIGDDLKEGEPVVVVGNYSLEDGMKVQTREVSTATTTQAGKED